MGKYFGFLVKVIVTCILVYIVAYFTGHHEYLHKAWDIVVDEIRKHINIRGVK